MTFNNLSGFDWDNGNRQKCQKHGVTIYEIENAFRFGTMRFFPDVVHSSSEVRYIAVGTTKEGRNLFVSFTIREKNEKKLIRPVSVRYMHQKEIDYYEKTFTRS